MEFKILIERDEDGWFVVTVPSLPGCVSQGRTGEEAKRNIAEAIGLHLGALAVDREPVDRELAEQLRQSDADVGAGRLVDLETVCTDLGL